MCQARLQNVRLVGEKLAIGLRIRVSVRKGGTQWRRGTGQRLGEMLLEGQVSGGSLQNGVFGLAHLSLFILNERVWQAHLEVLADLVESNGASGGSVIAVHVANIATNLRIMPSLLGGGTNRQGRDEMTFSNEFTSKAANVLLDRSARGARPKTMSGSIPWELDLVAYTLVVKMKQ